jgi:hypothetical protein
MGRRRDVRRIGRLAALVAAAAVAVGVVAVPSPALAAGPCGTLAYDPSNLPRYDHVIVIMDENTSYQTWLSANMPYTHGLAAACGSETNMHSATHPSKNNYAAATSGEDSTYSGSDNIFHQLQTSGRSWANYAESEGTACQLTAGTFYKTGHVPGTFYSDLRSPTNTCRADQLPMDSRFDSAVTNDTLPAYTWISPNECHGTYWVSGCSTTKAQRWKVGDTWLSTLIPRLTAMPSYQAGHTLIVITWDEGDKTGNHGIDCTDPAVYSVATNYCWIPTIVVSPYITPGVTDGTDHNLYGLLATAQDILAVPRLNRAVGQTSMRPGLGF